MQLPEARHLAASLTAEMAPYCHRVEIAGSIRRERPDVKDVEIVAVPKWGRGTVAETLFDEPPMLNKLLSWAFLAESRGDVTWIKPGTHAVIPWEPKRDGKYWRGLLRCGVKLDLFLATPENFGLIYLIRTGSAEFSEAVVTHGKAIGVRSQGGQLVRGEEVLPTPEEADVFRLLGLAEVAPAGRTGREALRGRG